LLGCYLVPVDFVFVEVLTEFEEMCSVFCSAIEGIGGIGGI
jgi:hypothetical protein